MLQLCFNFFSNLNAPPILTHPFISWYLITFDGSKLRVGRASLGKEEGLSTILWLCDPQKLCKNTQWPQELFGVSQSSEAKQAGTLQPPQNKPQRSPQMFPETQHKLKSASTPIPPKKTTLLTQVWILLQCSTIEHRAVDWSVPQTSYTTDLGLLLLPCTTHHTLRCRGPAGGQKWSPRSENWWGQSLGSLYFYFSLL